MITLFNQPNRMQHRAKIIAAALAITGCACPCLYAENVTGVRLELPAALEGNSPRETALKGETAKTQILLEETQIPPVPETLSHMEAVRNVIAVSFIRRICRFLSARAVPMVIATVIETLASYIEKRIPSERIGHAVCDALSSLRDEIVNNESIKPQAREQIGELLAEFLQVSRCTPLSTRLQIPISQ